MSGLFAIGTKHLGILAVSSHIREPFPALITTAVNSLLNILLILIEVNIEVYIEV